ncbi:ribonuclease H2, subunit B [Phaeosphaeriaceae sp. PMI808]|nr:ribonuclease H2, subunit B [Phaeosphaeriaceae sp. PMI808]
MARTRSKPKAKEPTPEPSVSTVKALPASTSNPPKLFVLPKDASKDARIITLNNPANNEPSKYFFCPNKGFHEFTRISAPKKECRSWLLTSETSADTVEEDEKIETKPEQDEDGSMGSGIICKSPDLFVATPIDTLFLLLPALAPKSTKETKLLFRELDDHIDALTSLSPHWKPLLHAHPALRATIEKRMRATCDTVDAGTEPMFRISHAKLGAVMLAKAEKVVARGLPVSMEERFVKSVLDVPVMNVARSEGDGEKDEVRTTLETPKDIPHLLRLRTSLTYMLSTYLPPTLRGPITTLLNTSTPTHDFAALDAHLAALAKMKAEVLALRSISDNMSRKRAVAEDEETVMEREEKRRRKEDEEKRKKSEGRGVKALKKVDTSGMKKMSSFFTKVAKKT